MREALGVGTFGAWMLSRNFLFKASGGIVTKMTDNLASVGIRASALGWIYSGQSVRRHRAAITLTTQDFLALYHAYIATLTEIAFVERLQVAIEQGEELPSDLRVLAAEASSSDAVVVERQAYREELFSLLGDQAEEAH